MTMELLHICFIWTTFIGITIGSQDEFLYGRFPDGFIWGASTSAVQIEGAWNTDGKGENIWDFSSHHGYINDTADIAADSYHLYKRDIEMLKELKVSSFRFSISWTRILPDGSTGFINQKGVDHYNKVINAVIAAGIEPMVTIYHFDMPIKLELQGGWLNKTTVEYFKNYSRICFEKFGDRVKKWFTINEPGILAAFPSEGFTEMSDSVKVYTKTRNLILAHAETYRVYEAEFKSKQNGKVGIVLNSAWMEPKNASNPDDVIASERAMEFELGIFANPIYINGDFPEVVKQRVLEKSTGASRLPAFSEKEKKMIKSTADFFALNHYSSRLASLKEFGQKEGFENDRGVNVEIDPSWPRSAVKWLVVTPFGMRKLLNWITEKYKNLAIMVTENGFCDSDGKLEDTERIDYLRAYINEMLKAIQLDGCNVAGYSVWTLMDDFEFDEGYSVKYGLYHVNFTDPGRKRTAKQSARFYQNLITENGFIPDIKFTTWVLSFFSD